MLQLWDDPTQTLFFKDLTKYMLKVLNHSGQVIMCGNVFTESSHLSLMTL